MNDVCNTLVKRPVFVVGCGRSGTTLLFQLMKAHPDLAPTTGHPDGEDHVGWIKHGDAVISGIYGNAETGDRGSLVGHACCLEMRAEHINRSVIERMHAYYAFEVLKYDFSKRVVNKCPHLSNKLGYVQALFPDAKFVHLIRDPVAMTASWVAIMKEVRDLALYLPQGDRQCLWVIPRSGGLANSKTLESAGRFYPGTDASFFADYWVTVNDHFSSQLERVDESIITVRYEDLIADTIGTLGRITDFCELPAFSKSPVEIDTQRNGMRADLLSETEVARIKSKTSHIVSQYGY